MTGIVDGWLDHVLRGAAGSQHHRASRARPVLLRGPGRRPRDVRTLRRGYARGAFNLSGPFAAQDVELAWATPILLARH